MFDLLIRNANVVFADGVCSATLAIEAGKIVDIDPSESAAKETIDATGLHVLPGMLDPHVHFNEPGRTDWEGIASGSSALAAGGGTSFFDMPLNSSPAVLDAANFDNKVRAAETSSFADFGLWGGLTPVNLDHIEALAERGVIGFKAFMSNSGIEEFPAVDDLTLYRGMLKAKQLGLPVAVHAESESLTAALAAEATGRDPLSWAKTRPIIAEVEAIQRALTLAEETGAALHIVHVSSGKGIEAIRRSPADVTCETCPHYLVLNEEDLAKMGTGAKCAPPLRPAEENQRLWRLLEEGKIDWLASDHSPCPAALKNTADFFDAWGGIAGVQSTLSVALSHRPAIDLSTVAKLTSDNAAERFRIRDKGKIAIGFDADLTLVDLGKSFELKQEMLLDRHKLSPFVGRKFTGVVRRTMLRGTTTFLDGQIVAKPFGRLLRPTLFQS